MKSLQLRLSSLALAACGALSSSAVFAQAAECAVDSDCDQGFTCQVTGVSGCAAPDCAPGEPCPPVACEQQEYRSCEPATDCESDLDCAAGMVCNTEQYEVCSASTCAPGQECEPVEPECEVVTETQCTPRSQLPCSEAADCGEGFDCVMYEECNCSGGGGMEPAPLPPDEPTPAEPPMGGSSEDPPELAPEADPMPAADAGAALPRPRRRKSASARPAT